MSNHVKFETLRKFSDYSAALKEIQRLTDLVSELLPYLETDVCSGIWIGPRSPEHENDNCDDCQWHDESIEWFNRLNSSEFDDIPNIEQIRSSLIQRIKGLNNYELSSSETQSITDIISQSQQK